MAEENMVQAVSAGASSVTVVVVLVLASAIIDSGH